MDSGLPINPLIITWARVRSGYSIQDASRIFKKIESWEDGTCCPSYPQLEQMADKFKCPVAVFFFPAAPDLPNVEQSFRTLSNEDFEFVPRSVHNILRRAQAMQINLVELNDGNNPSPKLITRDLSFKEGDSSGTAALAVREYLGISVENQVSWKSADFALDCWRNALAECGIFVFKEAFRTDDYFGFCIYDSQFPIIYINNSASKTRQIFTLVHELAHLLFRTSGIDSSSERFLPQDDGRSGRTEAMCNEFANKVLVPDNFFDLYIKGRKPNRELAAEVAEIFCVSREVIYRKFLNRRLIIEEEYLSAVREWRVPPGKAKESAGNFYNTQFSYLGMPYINLAFRRYYQRRFDEVQLADYLNIKPRNLSTFETIFSERV